MMEGDKTASLAIAVRQVRRLGSVRFLTPRA